MPLSSRKPGIDRYTDRDASTRLASPSYRKPRNLNLSASASRATGRSPRQLRFTPRHTRLKLMFPALKLEYIAV